MKRSILLFMCISGSLALNAQDVAGIVSSSRNRIQADTVSTRSRMVITAKDGTTTERQVDQYSIDTADGNRTVVIFHKPASIAGTRFLTVENKNRADDRWIYLPSLGKVRRISASEGSGSFMGTDFSYDDVSSSDRDANRDTHSLVREEVYAGTPHWVIQSVPVDTSYQYSKMISWIEKDSFITRKIEMYDKRGDLVKRLEITSFEEVQGRLSPKVTRMTSVQSGTSTTIHVEILKYDDPVPDSVFTTRFLETGRP